MSNTFRMIVSLFAAVALLGLVQVASADEALDNAMAALKTYDWGQDRAALNPIDQAVAASHGDAAAQKALEAKLVAVLGTDATRAAKDFVCRQLSLIGTADSVPALAALLPDEKLSHMGRYALERIGDDAATKALRDAVGKVGGLQKVGVINSLGVLRDARATGALAGLLGDSDDEIASAAAAALGSIGTSEASKALLAFQRGASEALGPAAADALLTCAERLLAAGNKVEALLIYKTLSAADQPKHVRLAAMRGMLAATGKN